MSDRSRTNRGLPTPETLPPQGHSLWRGREATKGKSLWRGSQASMTEPRTEAGRRLLNRLMTRGTASNEPYGAAIAAIEAEAAAGVHLGDEGLDVERLATVICHREHVTGYVWCRRHKSEAEAIAAEYARLTEGDSR